MHVIENHFGNHLISTAEIERVLDRIRPHFQEDGGDIEVQRITDDMIVQIELKGSCKVCNVNKLPTRVAMERILKESYPEIKGVELV